MQPITLVCGDSRHMKVIEDRSIDLIITSPPYWQLKDYGDKRQIGYHDSYEEYIKNLNLVWSECSRVLKNGCRMCVNVGDQYMRTAEYGRHKVMPIHCEVIRYCESIGLDYMGQIIWKKVCNTKPTGGAVIMGSYPYPRNGIAKYDFEYILLFKKRGEGPKVSKADKERARLTKEEWNTYFAGHWTFPGKKQKEHKAMFPEELPKRLIKMYSFPGETVFDPFAGSGTTMKVARDLKRNSIGYEINPDYISIAVNKLNANCGELNLIRSFSL